jgi:hypothetical protein
MRRRKLVLPLPRKPVSTEIGSASLIRVLNHFSLAHARTSRTDLRLLSDPAAMAECAPAQVGHSLFPYA